MLSMEWKTEGKWEWSS